MWFPHPLQVPPMSRGEWRPLADVHREKADKADADAVKLQELIEEHLFTGGTLCPFCGENTFIEASLSCPCGYDENPRPNEEGEIVYAEDGRPLYRRNRDGVLERIRPGALEPPLPLD